MTAKVVRIVLVVAMLFSSIGVSAASIACKQKQRMATTTCTKCKSSTPKSCCKTVYSHLSVKTEYQRPVASNVDAGLGLLLAVLAERPLMVSSIAIAGVTSDTGPPIALGSLERCSLISTYRI